MSRKDATIHNISETVQVRLPERNRIITKAVFDITGRTKYKSLSLTYKTRSQAAARIADRTASQQTL